MSVSIAITAEGILRQLIGGAPVPQGQRLYAALGSLYRLVVLTDEPDATEMKNWLYTENFRPNPVWVLPRLPIYGETPNARWMQLARARNYGAQIDAVIDPDPAVCAYLLSQGFLTLNALHPSYALPEWRPDYDAALKPWDEIEAEIDRQRELRNKDRRILEDT